jgi:hypothetical protein
LGLAPTGQTLQHKPQVEGMRGHLWLQQAQTPQDVCGTLQVLRLGQPMGLRGQGVWVLGLGLKPSGHTGQHGGGSPPPQDQRQAQPPTQCRPCAFNTATHAKHRATPAFKQCTILAIVNAVQARASKAKATQGLCCTNTQRGDSASAKRCAGEATVCKTRYTPLPCRLGPMSKPNNSWPSKANAATSTNNLAVTINQSTVLRSDLEPDLIKKETPWIHSV